MYKTQIVYLFRNVRIEMWIGNRKSRVFPNSQTNARCSFKQLKCTSLRLILCITRSIVPFLFLTIRYKLFLSFLLFFFFSFNHLSDIVHTTEWEFMTFQLVWWHSCTVNCNCFYSNLNRIVNSYRSCDRMIVHIKTTWLLLDATVSMESISFNSFFISWIYFFFLFSIRRYSQTVLDKLLSTTTTMIMYLNVSVSKTLCRIRTEGNAQIWMSQTQSVFDQRLQCRH